MDDSWWVGTGPSGSGESANNASFSNLQVLGGGGGGGGGPAADAGGSHHGGGLKRPFSSTTMGLAEEGRGTAAERAQAQAVERDVLHFLEEYF